jgi:hypothetical protein
MSFALEVSISEDTAMPFTAVPDLHNLELRHESSRPTSSYQHPFGMSVRFFWMQQM